MKNLWSEREAAKAKDKLDLLVYRSRLIGSEPELCVWGGGNTSTKTSQLDHLGRMRRVLLIKGSGSDLKSSVRRDYPPVALDDLLETFKRERMSDDEMVDFVSRCLLDPKAPRPSIEVLLHAFVDYPDIDHTHADAILSITNTPNGRRHAREIYGEELLWVPYVKPGFTLAKWVGEAYRKNPHVKGVILEKHGLITWGPDARTSYSRTIEMVTRAERHLARARKRKHWSAPLYKALPAAERRAWLLRFLPVVRREVSANQKVVLHHESGSEVMDFAGAKDTVRISQKGPATPDHMLRTRRVPLYVKVAARGGAGQLTEASFSRQIAAYAEAHKRYFLKYRHLLPGGTAQMLDPFPKVILVPGVGMITTGSDLKNARIVAEIYEHSIAIMKNASALERYESLSEKLAFEMDYWPLELYKLSLAPPEAELSRRIGLVTGAARGIGKASALCLAKAGAHVFLADIHFKGACEAACEINEVVKAKRAFALEMDVTRPASVAGAFEEVVTALGGLDFLVSNAGWAHVSSIENLKDEDWERSMAVNARGHFLAAREAVRIMKRQKLGGAIVFIASKNVPAPGRDFGAYSAAKAAQTQLARILAIENGEAGIRVNVINPDGVFEDSGLWETIGPERAKSHGIDPAKLKDYYKDRNLMKTPVRAWDVAEAVLFLISGRSAKTTGCILPVDGGLREAFPR